MSATPYDKSSPWNTPQKWDLEHINNRQTPPAKPKPITIADVFPQLDRYAIGFEETLNALHGMSKSVRTSTYPPYNLSKFGDDKFEVRIAVAGFKKEDISITVKENTLTISSTKKPEKASKGEIMHQGIAERDFTLNFALADHVVVSEAVLEDGMLTISLEVQLPEEKKPKVIDIK